jgi:hypothetical protein
MNTGIGDWDTVVKICKPRVYNGLHMTANDTKKDSKLGIKRKSDPNDKIGSLVNSSNEKG